MKHIGRQDVGGDRRPNREASRERLRRLALLMDSRWRIPGTDVRLGLDPILGLMPGVGDLIGAGIALYILVEARRLGASREILLRMLGNILLDWGVGTFPVLGDLFDVAFKANVRNLRLLGIDPARVESGPA